VPAGFALVGRSQPAPFDAYASSIDEDDEAELDGLHIVVGDFRIDDDSATQPRSSSTASGFS